MFSQITEREERRYLLGYWRFLLGWHTSPPNKGTTLTEGRRRSLRTLARKAVKAPTRVGSGLGKVIEFKRRSA